jgi:hypothetical protein
MYDPLDAAGRAGMRDAPDWSKCPFHRTFPTNLTKPRYYLAPGTPIARLRWCADRTPAVEDWEPYIAQKTVWYEPSELLGRCSGSPYAYIRLPLHARPFCGLAVMTVCFFYYNADAKTWAVPLFEKNYLSKVLGEILIAIDKNVLQTKLSIT